MRARSERKAGQEAREARLGPECPGPLEQDWLPFSLNFLPCTCPSVLSPGSLRDSRIKSVTQNREPRAFLSKRTKGVGVGEAVKRTNDKCRQRVSCEVSHSLPEPCIHMHITHALSPAHALTHPSRHTLEEEVKPAHQSKRDCSARALIFQTESLQALFPPSD